jgi:kynureninase
MTKKIKIDSDPSDPPSIYLCGNSLGLQPKCVKKYIDAFLRSWAIKGVRGHFDALQGTPFPTYLDADTAGSELLAPLVGASPHEVALMGTLTGNLHLLLASFYLPTKERFKIIMEGKAFPSDHVCGIFASPSFDLFPLFQVYLSIGRIPVPQLTVNLI